MLTLVLCGAASSALAQREKVQVELTGPANGSVHHAPATIALSAHASSALLPALVLERANPQALAITKVEFFAGTELIGAAIGQQPDSIYRVTWTNPAPGVYAVTAKATNDRGDTAVSAPIALTVNARPVVSIIAPQHQSIVTAPASVVVSAQATDADGTVASVEFFNGATPIGSATAAPFATTLANLAAGNYTFSARVTDNHGATSVSSPVTVTLNAPPAVSLSTPAAVVTAPGSFQITAAPTDADGTIQKVDFFQGGTPIATATSPPFTASTEHLPWGTYTFTAVVTDNHGATGTSTPLSVRVNAPPSVTLSSTSTSFRAPANVPLTALPLDLDGTIASVQLFNGTGPIATLTGAPFNLTWQSVPQGTYTLTAVVTDDLGATVTSAPFLISVASAEMKLYFIHVDHLNTPRLVADEQQRTVWRWDQSEPFGNSAADENPTGVGNFDFPLRMAGQHLDKETNLHYNSYRDYDPGSGRYIESDPLGIRAALNTYSYVGGNPLSWSDPSGLKAYQCRKPLDSLGGTGTRSGPDVWGNPNYHQYSCVVNAEGGVTCGGQDRSGSAWGSPGKPTKDGYDKERCLLSYDDPCFDDCLMSEWKKPRPWYGIPFGVDCQEYDDGVNQRCRKKCRLK